MRADQHAPMGRQNLVWRTAMLVILLGHLLVSFASDDSARRLRERFGMPGASTADARLMVAELDR